VQGPHDLEALEYDDGIGIDRESLTLASAFEVALMRRHPPREGAIAAAGIPRKALIDLAHGFGLNLSDANDATRGTPAIHHNA